MKEKLLKYQLTRAELFRNRLYDAFLRDTCKLDAEYFWSKDPVPFKDRLALEARPIREGERFGKRWDNAWFHFTCALKPQWIGKPVWIRLNLGGEILLFDDHGVPVSALTNHSQFNPYYRKEHVELLKKAEQNSVIDFWCEVCANGLFGEDESAENGICSIMAAGSYDDNMFQLWADVNTLHSLAESYEKSCARKRQILSALETAEGIFADDPDNAAAAREVLKKQLDYKAADSELTAVTVGHAHIDVGWLWAVKESIRKAARTFASQLACMDEHPDYIFGASQPQLYQFVKDNYPELYEKIRERIKEGRWECQGGMWVEADCNIISGESMVRQFIHGKNFFKDEFGIDVKNLWIPDVFGYSAAMPQIIKKAGCDHFLTQKISWSQFNKFPYHTFMWQGIDGTRVLTHFPPEDTYNSDLAPKGLNYARDNFNEATFLPEFMVLAGIGDGGGGPSFRHLANAARCADLEGVPKVKFGKAADFFKNLEKYIPQLPEWVGELYLELHRGTLTTQSRTKRNNRKCEELLAAAEFICSCLPAEKYPAKEFDRMWKTVLCNQFHDIIPGSSVRQVYTVTEEQHAEILATCEKLIAEAGKILSKQDDSKLTLLNTLGCSADQIIALPDSWNGFEVTDADGNSLETQYDGKQTFCRVLIPPASGIIIKRGKKCEAVTEKAVDDLVLENELIRYEFDRNAVLVSAYDKELKKELVSGGANRLAVYVDQPINWDAWDIDHTYMNTPALPAKGISAVKSSSGNLRQALSFKLAVGKRSVLEQEIVLTRYSKQLDFITKADWHEEHRMLRTAFQSTINSTEAVCDIQYGYVRRPTHTNTSWDFARFEVAAQKYADISDCCCGFALLNDCKYGYHLASDTLDLNLLRSPKHPDAEADQGSHAFTYSFLPHTGAFDQTNVISRAAQLNRSVLVLPGEADIPIPFTINDAENVTIGAVKKAEKSNDLIIRLVETCGRNGLISLKFADRAKISECDLLEWNDTAEVAVNNDNSVELLLKPFEIKTLRIKR